LTARWRLSRAAGWPTSTAFLAPLQLPLATEHGAQRRDTQGRVASLAEPDLRALAERATELAAHHDGLRVEIKQAAVACITAMRPNSNRCACRSCRRPPAARPASNC
jgi:trehalose 6-phosphate phosphatase